MTLNLHICPSGATGWPPLYRAATRAFALHGVSQRTSMAVGDSSAEAGRLESVGGAEPQQRLVLGQRSIIQYN